MSQMLHRDRVAEKATVHQTHPVAGEIEAPRAFFNHTFELPSGVYAVSLGCFLTFLATMVIGFGNPELGILMVIFGVFFAGFYGIPVLFVRQSPAGTNQALTWGQFKSRGIMTLTGRLPASEALAQVLVLPVLIVLWGIACVVIAALV
jgi:hypothetical protein